MPAIPEAIWQRLRAFLDGGEVGQIVLEVGLPGRITGATFNGEVLMAGDEKLQRMVRGMVLNVLRDAGVPVAPKPTAPVPPAPVKPAPTPAK